MNARRICAALVGGFAVPLSVVALAWACVPQGSVTVNPPSADSGVVVTVQAAGFPAGTAVDVHWNALDGPVLASGTGPAFSASVTVPDAAPGYYVVVAATSDIHAVHSQAAVPFEVTGAAPPPPAPAPDPVAMNPFLPPPAAPVDVAAPTPTPPVLSSPPVTQRATATCTLTRHTKHTATAACNLSAVGATRTIQARLLRGNSVYATTKMNTKRTRMQIALRSQRPLTTGHYTLTLTSTHDHHTTRLSTQRLTLR